MENKTSVRFKGYIIFHDGDCWRIGYRPLGGGDIQVVPNRPKNIKDAKREVVARLRRIKSERNY